MRRTLVKISTALAIGIIICAGVMSCSGQSSESEAADSTAQTSPTPYSNGKARALLEKYDAGEALSDEDLRQALDMIQAATDDICSTMSDIVSSATTQVELVENAGNKQKELNEKYKYVRPLIDMATSLTPAEADASLIERAKAIDAQIKDKFAQLEEYSRKRFAPESSEDTHSDTDSEQASAG